MYFYSKEVSFHDYKLRLLRNDFAFKEIRYDEIKQVEISKGFLLKNNVLIILLGLAVVYFGVSILNYGYIQMYNESSNTRLYFLLNRASILSVWGPILLIISGLLAIYVSFIRTHIITIYVGKSIYKRRIREISKLNAVDQLGQFLVRNAILTINKS